MTVFVLAMLIIALLTWAVANARLHQSGVPAGRVILQDVDRRRAVTRPLISPRYGLVGKPDYLVDTADGLVPVELKSRRSPNAGPHPSDVAQVMAYCVLIEDVLQSRPPYGIIAYADRHHRIPYTPAAKENVLAIVSEMIEADAAKVHRCHSQRGRCIRCGFRAICDDCL